MSRTVKSAIFFSAIGIAVGIGIMLLIVDAQTLGRIFLQPLLVGGGSNDDGNNQEGNSLIPFAIRQNYNTTLAVGEDGAFLGVARVEKNLIHLNGNLATV